MAITVMGVAGSSLAICKTIVKNIGNPSRKPGWTYTTQTGVASPSHMHTNRLWATPPL